MDSLEKDRNLKQIAIGFDVAGFSNSANTLGGGRESMERNITQSSFSQELSVATGWEGTLEMFSNPDPQNCGGRGVGMVWPVKITHCLLSCSVVSDSLWPYGLKPARLLCPWDSPGKNTGVGSHALLQRIFLTRYRTPISHISCIDRWVLYH